MAAVDQSLGVYPTRLLEGATSALFLFGAGFLGANDAGHARAAGVRATVVDIDRVSIGLMRASYPDDWEFVEADAFSYAKEAIRGGWRWDVVSVDSPTDLFDRAANATPLWCRLARTAVVLGIGRDTQVETPDGWQVSGYQRRSGYKGGVYWAIIEPRSTG